MDEEIFDGFRRFGIGQEDGQEGEEPGEWKEPIREKFTKGEEGKVWGQCDTTYDDYLHRPPQDTADDKFYPFMSQVDHEFAHWAKTRGPSSTALDELLAIDGVCFCLLS